MHIKWNKKKLIIRTVVYIFLLFFIYKVVTYGIEEYLDWDNRKYKLGEARYTQQELLDYFEQNEEQLNKTVQLVLSESSFDDVGKLEVGMSIYRNVRYYNRHYYIANKIKYSYSEKYLYTGKTIKKYKNNYFNNEQIEMLNQLTDHYCDIITIDPLIYFGTNKKTSSYIRFIFMSTTFSTRQELIYMPDGSSYTDKTGEIMDLGNGWYYHYTAY